MTNRRGTPLGLYRPMTETVGGVVTVRPLAVFLCLFWVVAVIYIPFVVDGWPGIIGLWGGVTLGLFIVWEEASKD